MGLSDFNYFILQILNGVAGRSWALDSLISIFETNALVKGAVIGACFVAAWYRYRNNQHQLHSRRILLATLAASVLVLTVTKTISGILFFPRPYFLSQKIYHLEGGNLQEYPQMDFNVPLDDVHQEIYTNFLDGQITINHLGTFPSDNAGFFIAICIGILLVNRRIGLLALLWTILPILATKVITGMHYPLDIAAGGALAVAGFFLVKFMADRPLRRPFGWAASWTVKHSTLSGALLFVVVFEIASTLNHLFPIFEYVSIVGRHLFGL